MVKGRLPPPPDPGLKEPVVDFKRTFSAFLVLKAAFFPDSLTEEEKAALHPEDRKRLDERASRA